MKEGGVSVLLGRVLCEEGRTPASLLDGFDGYGVASISESEIIEIEGLTIEADAKGDPAHANICGLGKNTPKALRKLAKWEVPVPQ
jgi:hypothetical protein